MPDLSKPASASWNIPPKEQSGDLIWQERVFTRMTFKPAGMWIARPTEPREKELLDLLNDASSKLQVKHKPKLILAASDKPGIEITMHTAFNSGAIVVSTALADILTHEQMKAMMGQVLMRRKNERDDLLAYVALDTALSGSVEFVPDKAWDGMANGLSETREENPLVRLGIDAVPGMIAGAFQKANARKHVFRDDEAGAKVAGTGVMISALEVMRKEQEKQVKGKLMPKIIPDFLKGVSFKDRERHLREHAPASEAAR